MQCRMGDSNGSAPIEEHDHRSSSEVNQSNSTVSGGENGTGRCAELSGLDEYSISSDDVIIRKPSMLKVRRPPPSTTSGSDSTKKSVSFSSTPLEKSRVIINAPDCLHYMEQGSELLKVRSSGRHYKRTYFLDADMTEIRWTPSSKKKNKARILVEDMKEVRSGKNTELLRRSGEVMSQFQDGCAFSIIYGTEFSSLDLIAGSADEASIWVTGLTCLIAGQNNNTGDSIEDRQLMRDRWLLEVFEEADYDNKGFLEEGGVIRLVKTLNSGVATTRIRQKMKEVDVAREDNRGRLSSQEFVNLFKEISTRPEIYFLLVRYSSNGDYMTADDLLFFLEAEQRLTRITEERCMEIIRQHEPSVEGRQKGQLGIDGFTSYLLSEECDIFDPDHLTVCQDMTQPISHYFIYSSFNTYLLEDQLKGPSSVDGYVRALLSGCRYVELECWDGPNDEPIVYHGNTLTSKIQFKSVIDIINNYAFSVTEYPLIVSIEDHCSTKQQRVMAATMRHIFGDRLLVHSLDTDAENLPSPFQLRGKILVKGQKLPADTITNEGYVSEEDENNDILKKIDKNKETLKKRKLTKEMSSLVVYCQSKRFQDFQTCQQKQSPNELYSMSESLALRLASNASDDLVNLTKRFLTRVYPNPTRVDSSNYNPQDLWNCGCQLVALNLQTSGLMMHLNTAFFSRNGRCGFVLKPSVMRESLSFFTLHTKEAIPDVLPQTLHIRIISGQQLPRPKGSATKGDVIDPYIVVEVFGIPADCAEERTKTVPGNGHNPVFDESFEFQVNLAELAMVRFVVLDDDFIGDDFIGQFAIPFECVQTGYRHVRLMNNQGEIIPNAYLFVHIAITNKRGGSDILRRISWKEKLSRRGGSGMKRKHRRKLYPTVRKIGYAQVDDVFKQAEELFKTVTTPLKEAADLRLNLQEAIYLFREACGLAPICNMKQCIRNLANRANTSNSPSNSSLPLPGPPTLPPSSPTHLQAPPSPNPGSASSSIIGGGGGPLTMQLVEGYPQLEIAGTVPDAVRKAVVAFGEMISECKALIRHGESLHEKLLTTQRTSMEYYENLNSTCESAGLSSRKASRVTENFTWNVRLVMGQADLLVRSRQEALDICRQSTEAGRSTGLMAATPHSASPGREPCCSRDEWQARADEETVYL